MKKCVKTVLGKTGRRAGHVGEIGNGKKKRNRIEVISVCWKPWTKEEIEYLEESWGYISVPTIAKNLGRTEHAVHMRKNKMNLGAFLDNGDYVTWNQFQIALGNTNAGTGYKHISWVKNRGFPLKKRKVNRCSFYVVYLEDWWKWAEKNKSFLDFSGFEENTLGKEPDWVKEKRRHDIERNRRYISTPWTKSEDQHLKLLIDQHKYYYSDISKMMRRTEGAIQRRCIDLGLKGRPLRKSPHSKWEDWQLEKLHELIDIGVSYEQMSQEIGKSAKAIRGKVYNLYGTEVLDKVRKKIELDKEEEE